MIKSETIKNLLMGASLITAGTFLTGCSDDESGAKLANQNANNAESALDQIEAQQTAAESAAASTNITAAQADISAALDDLTNLEHDIFGDFSADNLPDQSTTTDSFKERRSAFYKENIQVIDALKVLNADLAAAAKKSYVKSGYTLPSDDLNIFSSHKERAKITAEIAKLNAINLTEIDNDLAGKLNDFITKSEVEVKRVFTDPNEQKLVMESLKKTISSSSEKTAKAFASAKTNITDAKKLYEERVQEYLARETAVVASLSSADSLNDFANQLKLKVTVEGKYRAKRVPTQGNSAFNEAITASFANSDVVASLLPNIDGISPNGAASDPTNPKDLAAKLYNSLTHKIQVAYNDPTGSQRWQVISMRPDAEKDAIKAELIPLIEAALLEDDNFKYLFEMKPTPDPAFALASGMVDLSANHSFRTARTSKSGVLDLSRFALNGASGQELSFEAPVFLQLNGNLSGSKSTEGTSGSVAYRLGNTVIGALQAFANSGDGFASNASLHESSVMASHSFGAFFAEAQFGSVSANDVDHANWSGTRSQFTLGVDTQYATPFVQASYRSLSPDAAYTLDQSNISLGLELDIAKIKSDTHTFSTRLLTKVGYGAKNWTQGSKSLKSEYAATGSVEWSASLNLNSGIAFSTNLGLDSATGASTGLNFSLSR